MKKNKFISEYSFRRIVSLGDDRIVEDLIDRKVVSVAEISWLLENFEAKPRLLAKIATMPLLPQSIHQALLNYWNMPEADKAAYQIILEPLSKNPFTRERDRDELRRMGVATILLNPAISESEAIDYLNWFAKSNAISPCIADTMLKCKYIQPEHIDSLDRYFSGELAQLYPQLKKDINSHRLNSLL